MSASITDTNPDRVDAVLALTASAFVAAVIAFIYLATAGLHAAEPDRVTPATAPGATAVIATIEEDSP